MKKMTQKKSKLCKNYFEKGCCKFGSKCFNFHKLGYRAYEFFNQRYSDNIQESIANYQSIMCDICTNYEYINRIMTSKTSKSASVEVPLEFYL